MPYGKGTYGTKRGRPPKKKKVMKKVLHQKINNSNLRYLI